MPRTIVIESYEEWAARQGGEPMQVGAWLVFANGARVSRENSDHRMDPPTDPAALLALKRAYAAAALKAAEKEFDGAKMAFSEQAALALRYSNLPGAPLNAPQILEDLKQIVVARRQALAAIQAEVDGTPEAEARRAREQAEVDRRSRAANLQAAIRSVSL